MRKSLNEVKEMYTAYLANKTGDKLERHYKAGKDTGRLIWMMKVKPAIDKFFNGDEKNER